MAKTTGSADRELAAISSILQALKDLDGESIQRVLDYVFNRLSITAPRQVKAAGLVAPRIAPPLETGHIRRPSIRDLKEEKQPESSNQMAALVAYYLSEIADVTDRKEAINASDVERYFKQAGFKLPKSLSSTLPNATAVGYFDPVGGGQFKLNPIGYNLVAHGLPRPHSATDKRTRQRPKKKSKKAGR